MIQRKPSRRVLVLGDNALAALATVRSLGRAGLEVHLVSWRASRVTRSSRYVRRVFRFGDPEREPAAFVERVLALVAQGDYDLVLPVMDEAMIPLMAVAERIHQHSIFAAPDRLGFETTHNKAETIKLARELGVDIPATALVYTPEDIESLSRPANFPLILKPALGGVVRKVRSPEALRDRLSGMIRRGPVLVQEFCPGRGLGVEVLADHGEIVAAFQHRRVHEPPEGGASTFRASMPLSPELLEIARAMCRKMAYTGPAMFEFKLDPSTGRAPLMEINGRFWGSLALSIDAGVDFPRLLYDLLVTGKPINSFSYRVPCYARCTQRDLFWFPANLRTPAGDPELLRSPLSSILAESLHLLTGRERFDVERLHDPVPAWHNCIDTLKDVAATVAHQLQKLLARRAAGRIAARMQQRDPRVLARLARAGSVLFLCTGNINRSAFAERCALASPGVREDTRVSSAGFLDLPGRCTSPTSLQCARSLGIDLAAHRSRTADRTMLAGADVIFVMEPAHVAQALALDPACKDRLFMLGALDPNSRDPVIVDPYATDTRTYTAVYEKIRRCIDAWQRLAQASPAVESRPCHVSPAVAV